MNLNIVMLELGRLAFKNTTGFRPVLEAVTLLVKLNALNESVVAGMEEACRVQKSGDEKGAEAIINGLRPHIDTAFEQMINECRLEARLEVAFKVLVG